jgi:hypothetical protein
MISRHGEGHAHRDCPRVEFLPNFFDIEPPDVALAQRTILGDEVKKESATKDVIVIGGGAAGLMCAIEAGKRGRSVLVMEHTEKIGKKIGISGGGWCNFTNTGSTAANFLSQNPHFCKSALARFTPGDFIRLVEKHNIKHHEKKLGQLFCDGSSQEIVEMLLRECAEAGLEIRVGCAVSGIRRDGNFVVENSQGISSSRSLVVATGGLSFPKVGATDFGYRVAKQFGVGVTALRPGLVPLTFNTEDRARCDGLSGVSIDAVVNRGETAFRENILFTHRGLSGPAILQISSYMREGEAISIDLSPEHNLLHLLTAEHSGKTHLNNVLGRILPRRFVQKWCDLYAPSRPMNQYPLKELERIARGLHQWNVVPQSTEGFEKAEVTVGGVDTDGLSSKTMEAKNVSGLYFIGEVVDVTGHLGGHNFQWAWSSGYVAGQHV